MGGPGVVLLRMGAWLEAGLRAWWLATLMAGTLFAWEARAQASADPVGKWIAERAADWREWAEPSRRPEAPLWRERPEDHAPLAAFVPPTSLAPLIQEVRAGVVNIHTLATSGSGAAARTTSNSGSGFIISADGHVVTNDHVVARATAIQVRLADGRQFPAEVVGRDPATDVALLRLRGASRAKLPVTWLGDSDVLEQGDWVVAIGNPFGLDHSVSHGLISAKERVIGMGMFDDFIQTDALINPGNSGGPLFNMQGEVVGVTTAIVSQGQGIGFAVPINMVKDLLPNLRENGRLERGWLGVTIADVEPAGEGTKVTVVREVFADGPAHQAGLQTGDRVVAVNGRAVESYLQLMRRVAILAPGTETSFTVQRGADTLELAVRLGERPAESLGILSEESLHIMGMVLRPLDADTANARGHAGRKGLLVAGLVPRGQAQRAGIEVGDLLVEVGRQPVKDAESLKKVLSRVNPATPLLLKVLRGEDEQYLAIESG